MIQDKMKDIYYFVSRKSKKLHPLSNINNPVKDISLEDEIMLAPKTFI